MNILFIENKFKTRFWEEIAKKLAGDGNNIYWIVQNKLFKPDVGEVHYIPLPKKRDLKYSHDFKHLERKDRYCYIYKNIPSHYSYYKSNIKDVLMKVEPDVVFGEATLFHELLTIEFCKEADILYLHPTSCRYPNNRFSFYLFDTLKPYSNEKCRWSESELEEALDKIVNRKAAPDYMKKHLGVDALKYKLRKLKGLSYSFVTSGIIGEIYNTPPLVQKLYAETRRKLDLRKYRELSTKSFDSYGVENTIVYPLQMQPEANIDVWGYPHNCQSDIIASVANRLGEGWNILIKPNPKSKYEIDNDLLRVVEKNSNVVALSHDVAMNDLFSRFDYFYTVTGTINHECLLSGKFCFSEKSEVNKLFAKSLNCFPSLSSLDNCSSEYIENPIKILKYLVSTSFPGLIGDEIHSPQVYTNDNLESVASAFRCVIKLIGES